MPREIGLIFRDWEVRAAMLPPGTPGRKTQTRRIIKPQPYVVGQQRGVPWDICIENGGRDSWFCWETYIKHRAKLQVGDLMYAQEPWRTVRAYDRLKPRELPDAAPIRFLELERRLKLPCDPEYWGKTRSPMFLQSRFARRRFPVIRVRVEQGMISEEDAMAEGVDGEWYRGQGFDECRYRTAYLTTWEQSNGPGAMEKWRWVYEWA